ncbi:Esterase/lipase superfamily enzyme [Kaistia soli DSM 19436]|uniref:Esterase/lipase superfamily enzyme n=1 Tax=Kaistia soli DSM 19436 TaxID=1122133 RepID=A0A1M5GEK9_9HYPH|nr:alpha/beta hydrolase [Kaistia soli]SHG02167.1 Esterase/lipase superfamily enzyme [Kaistia soli DSM 19436]
MRAGKDLSNCWRGLLGMVLATLVLAGCASRPEGALTPVATDPAAAGSVDMLVATTRAADPAPGVFFNGERGTGLSLANVVISIPKDRAIGQVQWPRRVPGDPVHDFVATSVTPIKAADISRWFTKRNGKPRPVLIFVHGFNTPFDASVFRFAQIVHDSNEQAAPVLFSWPSRGRVLDYNYDRESANFSRSDLAFVIRAAARSPNVSSVTVMAHSMGGWVAVEALRQIALQDGRVPAKVSNVILASPDLDLDVFHRQMEEIGPKRPHITIFVSSNDRALRVSRLLSGGVTRVGAVDLTREPYLSQFERANDVTVIDLSALSNGDRLNHSKFATSPEIVQLLGGRMAAGQLISDADAPAAQIGATAQGAGQTIGSVAGVVLSAPVMIFGSMARN